MAERTVSVKLSANVAAYEASMRSAAAASTGFSTTTQASMSRLGGQLSTVGGTMSRALTVPLLAAGAGAIKLGMDFDTAFSRMVGLADVPANEIDALKESVLALAGETGQAPVALAEALYEAASAGLDSAQAMEAVEVAAKSAAAGMGSAQDIVSLVASATASYGAANIDAASAVDILTQTIREGRADPEELAGSLGRILPIAAQLGIGFADVGGAVAYMSTVLGDTDRAVTGVNDAMAKLSAPTAGAKQVLIEMGTSVEELHAALAEGGLLGGLELLREHGFAGNSDAIRRLMPDMQGAVTLTALLNDESGTLTETLANVGDSAGAMGEAFGAAADTDMFKMQQAWAKLQVALIEASDVILPMITGIVSGIGDLAAKFSGLPGPVQTAVIGFLAFVAAVGPLLSIGGRLVSNLGTLATMATNTGKAIGSLASSLGFGGALALLAVAVAGVGMYFKDAADDAAELAAAISDLARASDAALVEQFYTTLAKAVAEGGNWGDTLARIAQEQPGVVARMLEMETASGGVTSALRGAGVSAEDAASMVAALRSAMQTESDAAANVATTNEAAGAAFDDVGGTAEIATGNIDDYTGALGVVGGVTAVAAESQSNLADQLGQVADAIKEQIDLLADQYDAMRSSIDSDYALRDAKREAADAMHAANLIALDSTRSAEEITIAYEDATQAALAQADAEVRRADDLATGQGVTLSATDKNKIFIDSLRNQAAQANGPTRDALLEHIRTLSTIPPAVATTISTPGAAIATAAAQAVYDTVTSIPENWSAHIQVTGAAIAAAAAQSVVDAIGRVNNKSVIITVGAQISAAAANAATYLATGGRVGPGGAITGEAGPEHLKFPGGGQAFVSEPTFVGIEGTIVTPMGGRTHGGAAMVGADGRGASVVDMVDAGAAVGGSGGGSMVFAPTVNVVAPMGSNAAELGRAIERGMEDWVRLKGPGHFRSMLGMSHV